MAAYFSEDSIFRVRFISAQDSTLVSVHQRMKNTPTRRSNAKSATVRKLFDRLEDRLCMAIDFNVGVGTTLDIYPVSQLFPTAAYARMQVNLTTVPGTTKGTLAKLSGGGTTEIPWGTGAPNPFGPSVSPSFTQSRVFGGEGLRYKASASATVGQTETIPVTFSDSTGSMNKNDTLVFHIVSPVGAPSITTQPAGITSVIAGNRATLSVVATGTGTLTYKWYDGISPDTSRPFANSNSATFTTPVLTDSSVHHYWVKVSNSVGGVNSLTSTVNVGHLPTVDAGGPYTVGEMTGVTMQGTGTDPDNGLYLAYEWDFNNNGIYGENLGSLGDERGKNAVFTANGIDGPTSTTVKVRVTNDKGLTATDTATINVTNSAPKATLTTNGAAGLVSFANVIDSTADIAAMKYSLDLNGDGVFEIVDSAASSGAVPAAYLASYQAGAPVFGRMKDKDGAVSAVYAANIHGKAILVTTLADENNSTAAYEVAASTSLREAVAFAEAKVGEDAIAFDPKLTATAAAIVPLTTTGNSTNGASALGITGTLYITGAVGTKGITINGGGSSSNRRAFYIASTGALTLENLTLSNFAINAPVGQGGAIFNAGALTTRRSLLASNTARSTVANTTGAGGAVYSSGGTAAIENSTFTNNQATGGAGGAGLGGAIFAKNAAITILASTLSNNAATDGRGLYLLGDGAGSKTSAVIRGSILGQADATNRDFNTATANGGSAPTSSGTNNLIRSSVGFGGTASTADPLLGALGSNGGPTQVLPISTNSPAINGGIAISGISVDQRNMARPQGSAVDIGAVERQATAAKVTSKNYDFLSRQALVLNFDLDASVTFNRSNLILTNLTTGQTIAPGVGAFAFNTAGTQAVLTLTNLLTDGRYRLTATGSSPALDFFVLQGDSNRDGKVDFSDLTTLAQNYGLTGRTLATGDTNYDGKVDFADLAALAQRYNVFLANAASLAAPAGDNTVHQVRKASLFAS